MVTRLIDQQTESIVRLKRRIDELEAANARPVPVPPSTPEEPPSPTETLVENLQTRYPAVRFITPEELTNVIPIQTVDYSSDGSSDSAGLYQPAESGSQPDDAQTESQASDL